MSRKSIKCIHTVAWLSGLDQMTFDWPDGVVVSSKLSEKVEKYKTHSPNACFIILVTGPVPVREGVQAVQQKRLGMDFTFSN